MQILIIAPHADDEVLGCGGTIAKYTKRKDKVCLCIMTKAYIPDWSKKFLKNRPEEIKMVNKILGINKTFCLDYPTAKLNTISQKELNDEILKIIDKVKPDIMYIPHSGDLHKDHRIIFESSLVAIKSTKNRIRKILSYETLSETDLQQSMAPFIPNVYVDIQDTFEKKIKAMKAYKSELKQYPHPRSLEIIKALAEKRGSEVGLKFAEAFMLVREVML
jgi:LmbE family N-acetylglucosaminyl deacetylase